jgi:hypothetical protein
MINLRGQPVILDFGLARRQRQQVRLTQIGQPVGTPAYMSPEQVAGAVPAVGPGCDVYALGVILYQLLTGRLPFEGSVAEVLGRIVAQQPEPPSKHRPDLDPRLEVVCLKALRKQVADRYASMRDLAAALAAYLRCDPPPAATRTDRGSAVPPAAGRGARRRTTWLGRKWPWLLLAAGGAAAAILILLASFLWLPSSVGTIRIDLDGPPAEVEVQVDGERVESAGMNEPLRLRPGKHHLLVTGKNIQPVSTSFTVARGDNPVLQVRLVPGTDAAAEPLPPPPSVAPGHRQDDDRAEKVRPRPPGATGRRHDDDDHDDR